MVCLFEWKNCQCIDIFIYDSLISWKVIAALRCYLVVDNVSFFQCLFFDMDKVFLKYF